MTPTTTDVCAPFQSQPVNPPSPGQPRVDSWFDPATWTVTHLAHTGRGSDAVVIDPVLDFDPAAGRTGTGSAQRVLDAVAALNLRVAWILETHAHADHHHWPAITQAEQDAAFARTNAAPLPSSDGTWLWPTAGAVPPAPPNA